MALSRSLSLLVKPKPQTTTATMLSSVIPSLRRLRLHHHHFLPRTFASKAVESEDLDSYYIGQKDKRPPPEPSKGRDYEHWQVLLYSPAHLRKATRDQIIDYYIKILAKVVGSYHDFAEVMEDVVRFVYPDTYQDVEKKQYRGEPFINGYAPPYNPKYHMRWRSLMRQN